jgi:hypothetical protein
MAWINLMGCSNASTNPTCPGGVQCYDDEFTARALAAGGVIALDPNVVGSGPYQNYQYNGTVYDLTTQLGPPAGLQTFLTDIGWYNPSPPGCSTTDPSACFPQGAVVMARNTWQQSVPLLAIGNVRCSCWSPMNTGSPHCDVPCDYFNADEMYFPLPPAASGPIYGTYTPNNQTFQDFDSWVNIFNTVGTELNQAVSVLDVGWSKGDAAAVQAQLDTIWNLDEAIPVITWMPYAYATWNSTTPNEDIVSGMYDDYIAQFLTMLNAWLNNGPKRAYLRFAPQPNGNWFPWSPTCPQCGGNGQHIKQTPQSYVDMWKYVIGKVRSGAYQLTEDVLLIMFNVNNVDVPPGNSMEQYYPSDGSANWVGITGMNWGNTVPGNTWTAPPDLFTAMLGRLVKLSTSTPVFVSSASTSQPNGIAAKSRWLTDLVQYAVYSGIKMLIYHNVDSSTDLAAFGGSKGSTTYNAPLSGITYNCYRSLADAINNPVFGIKGTNSSSSRYLSTAEFRGEF